MTFIIVLRLWVAYCDLVFLPEFPLAEGFVYVACGLLGSWYFGPDCQEHLKSDPTSSDYF
jgi:hypothetical protein